MFDGKFYSLQQQQQQNLFIINRAEEVEYSLGEVGELPPPSVEVEGGLESGTGRGTGRAIGGGGGGGSIGVGRNGLCTFP